MEEKICGIHCNLKMNYFMVDLSLRTWRDGQFSSSSMSDGAGVVMPITCKSSGTPLNFF